VADRGLLVLLGLPNLLVELPQLEEKQDEGSQNSKAAGETADGCEIGKRHDGCPVISFQTGPK
jgi:hypothetical protein